MGIVDIRMLGSFPHKRFETCAKEGGHVCALKRGIEFLASQLGDAVVSDAKLTAAGHAPPYMPLGMDKKK